MIFREPLTWVLFVVLILWSGTNEVRAERWSRQVWNSEWIPLPDPRANANLVEPNNVRSEITYDDESRSDSGTQLVLPSTLQEQLIQLQRTQQSIQELLLLQQQLQAQQKLLQLQNIRPRDELENPTERERIFYDSTTSQIQAVPEVNLEILPPVLPSTVDVPPVQSYYNQKFSQDLPPLVQLLNSTDHTNVHPSENKKPQYNRDGRIGVTLKNNVSPIINETQYLREVEPKYVTKQDQNQHNKMRFPEMNQDDPIVRPPVPILIGNPNGNHDEVQLVYVPAEILVRRERPKKGRKPQNQQTNSQYYEETGQIKNDLKISDDDSPPPNKLFTQQIHLESDMNKYPKPEDQQTKKLTKFMEELPLPGRKSHFQPQKPLERIPKPKFTTETSTVQQKDILIDFVTEKEKRIDAKPNPPKRRKDFEQKRTSVNQHHSQTSIKPSKETEETSMRRLTTPVPNQPPLSVFMELNNNINKIEIADVLRVLRDAKTISVLDNFERSAPQIFVGPSNLHIPTGYKKFDLPYLSSFEDNQLEWESSELPFFVAPLNFNPPSGYSKIPFPAPHVGSMVISLPKSYLKSKLDSKTASIKEPETFTTTTNTPPPFYESSVITDYYQELLQSDKSQLQRYTTPGTIDTRDKFEKNRDNVKRIPLHRVKSTPQQQDDHLENIPQNYFYPHTSDSENAPSNPRQDTSSFDHQEEKKHEASRRKQNQHRQTVDENSTTLDDTKSHLRTELPPVSSHLPGLVNALLSELDFENVDPSIGTNSEASTTPTTTSTTTTTTTTIAPRSTFQSSTRGRHRGRTPNTKGTTTPITTIEPNYKPTRRPVNRSRSRFTTTTSTTTETPNHRITEENLLETTLKPSVQQSSKRPPVVRTHRYRKRTKLNSQSESGKSKPESQSSQERTTSNVNYISSSNEALPTKSSEITEITRTELEHRVTIVPPADVHAYNDDPQPSVTKSHSYYPEAEVAYNVSPSPDEYVNLHNYPRNLHKERHRDQDPKVEEIEFQKLTTIKNTPAEYLPQFHKQYSDDKVTITDRPSYESTVHANKNHYQNVVPHSESNEEIVVTEQTPSNVVTYHDIRIGSTYYDPDLDTISMPLMYSSKGKSEPLVPPSEESPLKVFLLQITINARVVTAQSVVTTELPSIVHRESYDEERRPIYRDSKIQTRPRTPEDEYVRFSVVNQGNTGPTVQRRNKQRLRSRPRTSTINYESELQTDGKEYVRIQTSNSQPRYTGTTTTSTTTTPANTQELENTDLDYGFIRIPDYQPIHSSSATPITRRTFATNPSSNLQVAEETISGIDVHQDRILKDNEDRQYYVTIQRPLKESTLNPTTKNEQLDSVDEITTTTSETTEKLYSRHQTDEIKPTTKTRSRIRRPGRKRIVTTTTPQPSSDPNNELPINENYPIIPQSRSEQIVEPQLDNADASFESSSERNKPILIQTTTGENVIIIYK